MKQTILKKKEGFEMTERKTKREYLTELINLVTTSNREEYLPYLEHELELLDNKRKNSKPTKTQEENARIMEVIVTCLTSEPATISEIQKRNENLKTLSNQKMSALLKKLIDAERVEKVINKKKAYFKLK